jgi:hypothetical protein
MRWGLGTDRALPIVGVAEKVRSMGTAEGRGLGRDQALADAPPLAPAP